MEETAALDGMPDPWTLRRVESGSACVVMFGPRVLFRYDPDDIGMRNLAVVALTDADVSGQVPPTSSTSGSASRPKLSTPNSTSSARTEIMRHRNKDGPELGSGGTPPERFAHPVRHERISTG